MFSSIEALRFIGAIMVVLFHLNSYPSGYKGVDLFFVISGFVLYYRYLIATRRHEPRSLYFVRRLSKIYVLYWTALLIYLLTGSTIQPNGFLKTFFLFPGHHTTLSVSWSLSYELYFYALFSAFLFIKAPAHRNKLLFSLLILSSGLTVFNLITFSLKGSGINFLLGHNTWEFVLGLSAGYLFEKRRMQNRWWISILLLTTLCLFCFLSLPFANPLSPVVYGICSFGLVYLSACLNRRHSLSLPGLTLLGLSSYAIYLFHILLLPFFPKLPVIYAPLFVILISLLSVLIYKFYEAPLLNWIRNRFARRIRRISH